VPEGLFGERRRPGVAELVRLEKFNCQFSNTANSLAAIVLDVVESACEFQTSFLFGLDRDCLPRRFARFLNPSAREGEVIPPDLRLYYAAGSLVPVLLSLNCHPVPPSASMLTFRGILLRCSSQRRVCHLQNRTIAKREFAIAVLRSMVDLFGRDVHNPNRALALSRNTFESRM
jgi:hypothetical protein